MDRFALLPWVTKAGSLPSRRCSGLPVAGVAWWWSPCGLGRKVRGGSESGGYDIPGFPKIEVLFQAAGRIEQVAPELYGPARQWRSLTPYLPVRHRKRESPDEYLVADVAAELGYRPQYRDLPPPAVARAEQGPAMVDRWASEFRRHRITEPRPRSRPGLGLRLEFPEPITGPLVLGQLSHFGYGIFVPDEA